MMNNTQRGNAVLWLIGLIALGVIAYFVFRERPVATPEGAVGGVSRQEVIMEGEVVCLPHRNTSGPTTMECAYGLRDDLGNYYGLDATNLSSTTPPEYEVGDRISIEGELVPQEDMPANFWNTYNITGLIALDAFWKFTDK